MDLTPNDTQRQILDLAERVFADAATPSRLPELQHEGYFDPELWKTLASTGLLCLVLSWNEAFWSLNLSSAKAGTLATLIASYSSPEGLFWAKLSAASLMAIAPIVALGWFCQKQLVQGLTFGAVK